MDAGDLLVENFFKELNAGSEAHSPAQAPVLDNVLVKLSNVTISRAVMTLAGTLEVQEPILEPASLRCDIKRVVGTCTSSSGAPRDLLLCEADLIVDNININLGQKDLATILAVWNDNFSESQYIAGGAAPSSPAEVPPDASVRRLQAFFAMGEPAKKEAVLRMNVEGVEVKLFSDTEEVLSSPVRDLGHGLARLRAGELGARLDLSSDRSIELHVSLDSLLLEDIRPDPTVVISRIFQSSGGSTNAKDGIEVCSPPVVDARFTQNATRDRSVDVRVERSRLNLCVPFVMQLARAVLDALPGDKTMDGGVVNHGYVGEAQPPRAAAAALAARAPISSDSTSGYYSAATSVSEDAPGLSISIHFQKPEVMFFTDSTKTEGHALLVRAEVLLDYSCHSSIENAVVSLVGLEVLSKLQSKLENLPPQTVLHPCDVELSRSFKDAEEGVKMRMSASNLDVHVSPTTVHAIADMIDEIAAELIIPEDKELFNFARYQPKTEKDEDLWSPKKAIPYAESGVEENYVQPQYPRAKPSETLVVSVPSVRIALEVERHARAPLLVLKVALEGTLHDWSERAHGHAVLSALVSAYDERLRTWTPVLEHVHHHDHTSTLPEITIKLFQAKAYPMSAKLNTDEVPQETETDRGPRPTTKAKRSKLETETSTDESDTEHEMVIIRSPRGNENSASAERQPGAGVRTGVVGPPGAPRLAGESDSEHESTDPPDRLSAALGHLFTELVR
ncbi:Vacuolar protein sorting-associated protein 13A [Eumeta japonica]|uniref:Vacuolar protein sorting-associated protein 13A n=1 Tax=Eumeta variegata TaxID=151549 RepID=A0A4C1VM07_EUMVA|nr:Vacuolar protein sorting-associated protein 13A [Eumeta japonica]